MPTGDGTSVLFVGSGTNEALVLARSLGASAELTVPPMPTTDSWSWDWTGPLEVWTGEIAGVAAVDRVVVCTWPEPDPTVPMLDLDPDAWRRQVEWPTALWFRTVVAAAGRCRDGGAMVVVADRPATLDAVGHGPAVVVAEGMSNVVRSLAAREGGRGVRVNGVFSSLHTDPDGLSGALPPLASFPGSIDVEVAGAVRLFLSRDSIGVTGTTMFATSGRR